MGQRRHEWMRNQELGSSVQIEERNMLRDWEAANFFLLIFFSAGKLEENFRGRREKPEKLFGIQFASLGMGDDVKVAPCNKTRILLWFAWQKT